MATAMALASPMSRLSTMPESNFTGAEVNRPPTIRDPSRFRPKCRARSESIL